MLGIFIIISECNFEFILEYECVWCFENLYYFKVIIIYVLEIICIFSFLF